jgi:hypothetical protein
MDEEFKKQIREQIERLEGVIRNKKNECYRVKYDLDKLRRERVTLKRILAGQNITGRPKKDEKADITD